MDMLVYHPGHDHLPLAVDDVVSLGVDIPQVYAPAVDAAYHPARHHNRADEAESIVEYQAV